jgi:hypothetical protein
MEVLRQLAVSNDNVNWKKELPMGIVRGLGAELQRLFEVVSEEAAAESGVIQRKREFTAHSLAQVFVLGHLQYPNASPEQLARVAAQCGAAVTSQAVDQRYTPRLVMFLEAIFRKAITFRISREQSLASILDRFSKVVVLDSTSITLPDSMRERFPGCGGTYGRGLSAMKLQTELDLRGGALAIEIEVGRSPDGATSRQQARHDKGALRITDLGYFNIGVFAEIAKVDEYFLSRLQFGTILMELDGKQFEPLHWLSNQPGPFVDQRVLIGKEHRFECRLIAWRVPKEQANRRRHTFRQESLRKYGKAPSAERLAMCDWTILVTNVPVEMLAPKEAVVLYRARWQVELMFKRWKSQDLVAVLSGATDARQMARIWARLIAAVVRHWLLVGVAWGDPTKSLAKICEAIRSFATRIAATVFRAKELNRVLDDLRRTIAKTCRRNKRKKPGTFELLNNADLLDYVLT